MIAEVRRAAALRFRALLERGLHRKEAIAKVCSETRIHRATLYRYCQEFGVSTK